MQTTPLPAAPNTPWSTHPGYDLSRYTSVVEVAKGYFAFEPATAGEGGAA